MTKRLYQGAGFECWEPLPPRPSSHRSLHPLLILIAIKRHSGSSLQGWAGRGPAGEPSIPPTPPGGFPTPAPSPAPTYFLGYFPSFHKRAPARHQRGRAEVPEQRPPGRPPQLCRGRAPGPDLARGVRSAEDKRLMSISQQSSLQRLEVGGSRVWSPGLETFAMAGKKPSCSQR